MNVLLHITTVGQWREALGSGEYRNPSLDSEGFIHCSTPEQLLFVANSLYAGRQDLVLLVIAAEQVTVEIRFEDCYDCGQVFPHIYGPLPLPAVTQVIDFMPGPDGLFTLPDDLLKK